MNYKEYKNNIKEVLTGKKFREWVTLNGKIINIKNKFFVNGNSIKSPVAFNTFNEAVTYIFNAYNIELKFKEMRG